ncbi:unnamed protein product [Calicophoron daubneyi]|uniref:Uncharacterized protein n=1 Tax=Calicophoron daubneyi TaxID=300641 RepID=A0AAV2U067_CALDB
MLPFVQLKVMFSRGAVLLNLLALSVDGLQHCEGIAHGNETTRLICPDFCCGNKTDVYCCPRVTPTNYFNIWQGPHTKVIGVISNMIVVLGVITVLLLSGKLDQIHDSVEEFYISSCRRTESCATRRAIQMRPMEGMYTEGSVDHADPPPYSIIEQTDKFIQDAGMNTTVLSTEFVRIPLEFGCQRI